MIPKIRMVGRYGDYRIGEVIAPPASLRKFLFDLQVAEYVVPLAPTAEATKRKRGRPRKYPEGATR